MVCQYLRASWDHGGDLRQSSGKEASKSTRNRGGGNKDADSEIQFSSLVECAFECKSYFVAQGS